MGEFVAKPILARKDASDSRLMITTFPTMFRSFVQPNRLQSAEVIRPKGGSFKKNTSEWLEKVKQDPKYKDVDLGSEDTFQNLVGLLKNIDQEPAYDNHDKRRVDDEDDSENNGDNKDNKKIALGRGRFVDVRELDGQTWIDIREYHDMGGELKPSKNGISLNLKEWERIECNMDVIKGKIKRFK